MLISGEGDYITKYISQSGPNDFKLVYVPRISDFKYMTKYMQKEKYSTPPYVNNSQRAVFFIIVGAMGRFKNQYEA